MVESDDPQDNNTQSIIIDTNKRYYCLTVLKKQMETRKVWYFIINFIECFWFRFRNINDLFEAALTDGKSVVVSREKSGWERKVIFMFLRVVMSVKMLDQKATNK